MTLRKPSQAIETDARSVKALGVDVHVIDENPSGAPLSVVLLPAQWLSATSFDRWARVVGERHRVIRLDLPGHGQSSAFPDSDYSAQHYAALLDAVLKQLALGPYVLVAPSFSGIAAAIHAATMPEGLRGLVLATASGLRRAAGAPKPNAPPPNPDWAIEDRPRPLDFYAWKLGTLLRRPVDTTDFAAMLGEISAMNEVAGRAEEARLRVAHHDPDALSRALPDVTVPMLIQWSSHSTYLPSEMAERVAALVPGPACVRVYPDTGHLLLVDAPEDCARDLLLFMETLS